MSTDSQEETFAFSADINQLMSLIINTFYSNKDIFLRELISNSSDALDKIRFNSIIDDTHLDKDDTLEIRIIPDLEKNTLTIVDTGIGMTKNDLINNLGTIAKSGTKTFMENLSANHDLSLIGQFGVGFYSAYLVANKVVVTTKHNDDDHYTWCSTASGKFTITKDNVQSLTRGTQIVLHMKDDMKDYLQESKIRDLIKKHSEFTDFPIKLMIEKEIESEMTDDEETEQIDEKKTKTVKEITHEFENLNNQSPIWMKNPNDVTQQEYQDFYKSISNDWQDHLAVKHFSVEGQLEFRSILYIPKSPPFEMTTEKNKNNVKLYVRKVFIMDSDNLLPEWLNFIKGVVDSQDLPLNISREILQQNQIMTMIKKNLVKKTIELFNNLQENEEQYKLFYDSFSKNIKLGIYEDTSNRNKLTNLLRFYSTKNNTNYTSFKQYISNMKEKQNNIYYITGDNIEILSLSPLLETFQNKDIEVLYMVDPIDEYMLQQLKDFEGITLKNISTENIDINTEEEKQEFENQVKDTIQLCSTIKEVLGNQIEKVIVSQRLKDSPCVIVSGQYGLTANMERILKAQTLGNSMNDYMRPKKIFEINPTNKIIQNLNKKIKTQQNEKLYKDLIWLLYDVSVITSGFSLEKPNAFGNKIHKLINLGLSIDDEEEQEEHQEQQEDQEQEQQQQDQEQEEQQEDQEQEKQQEDQEQEKQQKEQEQQQEEQEDQEKQEKQEQQEKQEENKMDEVD